MIKVYTSELGNANVNSGKSIVAGSWIDLVNPTEEELQYVMDKTNVNDRLIRYTIDTEETSHIDVDNGQFLISINVPVTLPESKNAMYTTLPLGIIILPNDYIITICNNELDILEHIVTNKRMIGEIDITKKQRLLSQILYVVSVEYISDLMHISKEMERFEDNLTKSKSNKDLVKLVSYQNAMIYFSTSIKTNQSVIERLSKGYYIKLTEKALQILDDTKIENIQALEMATTYSEILNGMTEIYGTIVSNSLNRVMKFLTSITLIISIPTLIASIMGMNVTFPFDVGVGGFYAIMIVTSLITIVVTWLLNKNDML